MNIRLRGRFPTFPEDFIDSFFFHQSSQAKPPYDIFPILDPKDSADRADMKGWEIQVALAGFKEEDIEVWHEGQSLHIKGDNTQNNVSDKFTCAFEHKFAAKDNLALGSAEVVFENGILSVKVPIKEPDSNKKYLYGK